MLLSTILVHQKRILFALSTRYIAASSDLAFPVILLVLVFLLCTLTLTPLVRFELEQVFLCLLRLLAYHPEEHLFAINQFAHEKTVGLDEAFPRIQSWRPIRLGQASSYT